MTYTDENGSVQNIDLTGLVTFDSTTDLLTIKTGLLIQNSTMADGETGNEVINNYANGTYSIKSKEKVTITFDALVTGEGVNTGDMIRNQARVIYNDLGFEQYNVNWKRTKSGQRFVRKSVSRILYSN